MSVVALWYLTCSVDGEPIDWDMRGETAGEAKLIARANGWKVGRTRRDPDFCPKHRPDRVSPKSGAADHE